MTFIYLTVSSIQNQASNIQYPVEPIELKIGRSQIPTVSVGASGSKHHPN